MDYIEVTFDVEPADPGHDLLAAELGELGYESFMPDGKQLLAYVPVSDFDAEQLATVELINDPDYSISWTPQAHRGSELE